MNTLSNEMNKITAELCSGKVNTRNKAAEVLLQKLTNSKSDLYDLLECGGSTSERLTWSLVFENAVDATLKHSEMCIESRGKKTYQTMVNKNHIFNSIITKIIEYNLEADSRFLAKATIIKAFGIGISNESSKEYFSLSFVHMLDRGIYSSTAYVRDLKINEYSRILSYLFEVDVYGDDQLLSAILKAVTRTVELAIEHVQIHSDLIDYLPNLHIFCKLAKSEQHKSHLVKLYALLLHELSIDYRAAICIEVQKLLPLICGFYDEMNMKNVTKVIFFDSLHISLYTVYPSIKIGNLNTMNVVLQEPGWSKTIKMIKTIVDMEIRHCKTFRRTQLTLNCSEEFIRLSALVTFITDWHTKAMPNVGDETPNKMSKLQDPVDNLLELLQPKDSKFDEIWFAIFAELISEYQPVLNMSNFYQVLEMNYNILRVCSNGSQLRNVRLCLAALMHNEKRIFAVPATTNDILFNLWSKFVDFILSDASSVAEVIEEKALMLQLLITYDKLSPKQCSTLLHLTMSNNLCKRNECIATIREVFIHAEQCGIDKTSLEVGHIISWAYSTNEKGNVTKAIHNIAPLDVPQLADTFAIGVINFLDKQNTPQTLHSTCNDNKNIRQINENRLGLLMYKYNQKIICLAEEDKKFGKQTTLNTIDDSQREKNCLFQINYELLMREVNYTIPQGLQSNDIRAGLVSLYNITCLMERFLHYNVFDADSFRQCPLIKRIGLFLSHLEFQFKSNNPCDFNTVDYIGILTKLEDIFTIYTSNEILLRCIELEPLEELINFVAMLLNLSVSRQKQSEFDDWSTVFGICLRILTILCASSSHSGEAFAHITKQNYKMAAEDTLHMIAIFCRHEHIQLDIAKWLVEKLKHIFKLYYTHIDVIDKAVDQLPAIFAYVAKFDEQLQTMLIALNSLLKIAFKKSYPIKLTVKILNCIAALCQRCRDIYVEQNFANICYSAAKFLKFNSLKIKYATISMLITLMNINLMSSNPIKSNEMHINFCEKLYEHIEWQEFESSSDDQAQNNISCVIQLLVSLFVFSSFHQQIALQDLVQFCASRKLTEVDFYALKNTVDFYKLTVNQLAALHIPNVLMDWTAKEYSITKFPYFLFAESKISFLKENSAVITAYLLLYNKTDEIKKLQTITVGKDIIEAALPIISAFLLVGESTYGQAEFADYQRHIAHLKNSLSSFGMDASSIIADAVSNLQTLTIYTIAQHMRDPTAFRNRYGFVLSPESSRWYQLDEQTMIKALHCYVCADKKGHQPEAYKVLSIKFANHMITKQPLPLVELLGSFKANFFDYAFTMDKLKQLFIYCTLAELIFDALDSADVTKKETANCYKYFVRDTIFFMLNLIKSTNIIEVQQMALTFLQNMLNKPSMCSKLCHSILKTYLNEICKSLVYCAQNSTFAEISQLAVTTIMSILTKRSAQLDDVLHLLDEFPANELFTELRQLTCDMQKHNENMPTTSTIEHFLATKQHSIGGLSTLQQHIARNKSQLQHDDNAHFELTKCLIAIVRDASKEEKSLDALKCLGEIGPLKFTNISYYFQTDFKLSEAHEMVKQPMHQFIGAMCEILDKHLLHFNARTHKCLTALAQHIVNWPNADSFIDTFPNLQVFRINAKYKNTTFDTCVNIKGINWLKALQATVQITDYDSWICAFMSRVFEDCDWQTFAKFAAVQSSFADECLEPFVKLLLADRENQLDGLCHMLEYFFIEFAKLSVNLDVQQQQQWDKNNLIFKEKRAVSKFLNICECVRIINDWKVPLTLINVIKASRYCQAYFMTIMYLELWANEAKNMSSKFTFASILENEDFQENAKQSYKAIGCIDAMAGFLDPLQSRLDYLLMENLWFDVLLQVNVQNTESNNMCLDVLKRNGMLDLANVQQKNTNLIDYEIYWRLGQWDMPVEGHSKLNTLNDLENEFKKHHYMALKSIYNREEHNSLSAILNARKCVLVILREISVECLQSVYKYVTWLQMLQQAEDFCKIQFPTATTITNIFEKWQTELNLECGNFQCKDYLLTHQITLFKTGGVRANRKILDYYKMNPIEQYLLTMLKECKKAGELNLAKRNIALVQAMATNTIQTKVDVLLEDADICLTTGQPQMAKSILQHIVNEKTHLHCPQRVTALRMEGEQLMESNAENFDTVLTKYFNGSLELLKNFDKSKTTLMQKFPECFEWQEFDKFKQTNRKNAYETIAKYANREYEQLNSYLNSEEYQTRLNIIKQNRLAADSLGKTTDRDKNVGAMSMKRFANLDEKELQPLEDKRTNYLCLAIESYIAYCCLDETFSDAVIYRIIALWLANKHNQVLQEKIAKLLPTVPSYKFICALNQLTARLNSKNQDFLNVLSELLVRCVQDHPQHTLYKLYPLIYASHDGATAAANNNIERIKVAKDIIKRGLTKANTQCVKQLDLMFPALIEYANLGAGDNRKTKITLSDKLRMLKHMDAVQCPTLELNVVPNGQYNIISIVRWDEQCTLVGGINVPKRLMCRCSDGNMRAQLLKGKDDLRQDAVMQQVFSLLNNLLKSQPKTAEKKLQLRTYKITPLSMRSGILEWCENTIPIGLYLAGDGRSGAHKKYRPNDYTNHKCRQISLEHLKKSTQQKRYEVYKHICDNIKPVFHYFLLEKFLVPGVWFERRLAYTNSVAVTSIVGFMLGLGDRHTQNILIDEKTAEVIHIDFGIAFDQGKIMPTAETVPFRLTRDMVSPMGVCETNGLFKKSCEMTMSLLRNYQSVITTVLEVLLYDPLYIWNVVPQQKASGDQRIVEQTNLTAKRALIAVHSKLNGQEPGMLGFSNVDVQIQRLINEATSARNLCLLYPGWDPYL